MLEYHNTTERTLTYLRWALRGFRQVRGGRSREYGGLGIGLAAARHLTEVLGGEIRVHSSPDRGSEFEVLLAA